MDRLHRIRLLLGDAAVERLAHATVMVVGCGAVGSFAIEALARSGVGHLILIDNDTVDTSNINRQLFALTSTVGMAKVDVAAARVRDINPDADVVTHQIFWDADTDVAAAPNIVIDAIDSLSSKVALYTWCAARGIPVVSSMGAARKRDISAIRVGKLSKTTVCPMAAAMRRMVRGRNLPDVMTVYSVEAAAPQSTPGHTFGSIVTVTGAFGLHLANLVMDYLVK
ncbi:tRNA threonylcarbamoyladenosine dehydratase [bacterium]|nr:tRNA threonylcarbamoyladenosine dehydratase [bacterium]